MHTLKNETELEDLKKKKQKKNGVKPAHGIHLFNLLVTISQTFPNSPMEMIIMTVFLWKN